MDLQFPTTHTLRADLAPTPPMGWNSFDSYGVYLHEKAALENLEAFAEKLLPRGYDTFVIDNGWCGEYRLKSGTLFPEETHAEEIRINEYGIVQPSKTYFPNGFGPIAKRARELGVRLGLHLMRGIPRKAVELDTPIQGSTYRASEIANQEDTCVWCHYNYGINTSHPGAQPFYDSLAQQVADWGFEFIKADDIVPYPQEIEALANAIDNCESSITLSLSPGGKVFPKSISSYHRGQMLRVTKDIWDNQHGIDQCFDAWRKWNGKSEPGFWIDMDMIPFGQLQLMTPPADGVGTEESAREAALAGEGENRWCQLSDAQKETFITLRSMSRSPLMIGGDLPTLDEHSLKLITHPEMIDCNQNSKGADLIYDKDDWEIWRAVSSVDKTRGWLGIFNRRDEIRTLNADTGKLGLPDRTNLENIWSPSQQALSLETAPNGCHFLAYTIPVS